MALDDSLGDGTAGGALQDAVRTFPPETPATAICAWFGPGSDSQGVVRCVAEGRLADVLAIARTETARVQADIHVEVGETEYREAYGLRLPLLRDSYPLAGITCSV